MTLSSRRQTFLNLFPAPEFLLLSTAGIALTDTHTRFIQLRREMWGGGLRLAHFKSVDNPKGAIASGLINNSESLLPVLKNLSSQYRLRYANVTLPEEKAYIFTTTIGWVPPEGRRDAVAFILEGNAPVSLTESIFDFEIISEDETLGEIRLSVCVLPENVVSAYTTLFESAGITPISFDLESQAIARAIIGRGDKLPYLVINLNARKTGFYIVEDEVVQFSTTLSYGTEESESGSNVKDLQSEMRKVLAFWSSRADREGKDGKPVAQIILCGSEGGNRDFVTMLMSESELPYTLANVWLNTPSIHSPVFKLMPEEATVYASALGLALPRHR